MDLYVKAGYADLAEYEKNKNSNFVSKNNIDTEGLDDNDIEELRRFAEFLKNKKKQNKSFEIGRAVINFTTNRYIYSSQTLLKVNVLILYKKYFHFSIVY